MFAADDSGTPLFLGEDLLAYLVLAFGAALFVGNLLAVLRPPPASGGEVMRAPVGRSLVMAGLGFVGANVGAGVVGGRMTISYRMLATIVTVVLLFGVGAAFVVDDDDDSSDSAAATTESPDDTKDDDETTTTTGRSSTSTTQGSTTSTTAASGATTTTTAASGGATTTVRPGATTTTTRPGATTTTPTTPPTDPPPTDPPPTTQPAGTADLLVHANVGGTDEVRRVVLTVENAGPSGGVDFTLTASGAGAPIRVVQGGSGFSCSDNGSRVTCTATGVGVGGRVREVTIEFGVAPGCAGSPVLTASVASSNVGDPNPGNNAITPRSLCPAAGSS